MTKRKVWRYKCDYCKKSGCSGSHIRHHEQSCTFNPNRICRLCPLIHGEDGHQRPVADMLKDAGDTKRAICWKPDEDGHISGEQDKAAALLARIREAAGGCPACMLTVIKALTGNNGWIEGFDFKAESKAAYQEAMNEISDARRFGYA